MEHVETSSLIPYENAGSESGIPVHFVHANGYPPKAYRLLFEHLDPTYHLCAMYQRPLWKGSNPDKFKDWTVLANDLERFLDERGWEKSIGIGHSLGGTTILRLALHRPDLFIAIVLLDPVIFPPVVLSTWDLLHYMKLDNQFYPLVRSARRRRVNFSSRQEMYDNYRKKLVFARFSNPALNAYVDALVRTNPDGSVGLAYPQEWEARIYATAGFQGRSLWRALPEISVPMLILYGQESDTFENHTVRSIKRKIPDAKMEALPDCGHLLPLEKPAEVAERINAWLKPLVIP